MLPGWGGLHSVNNLQVLLEICRLAEHIGTQCTLVRLSTGVHNAMSRQTPRPRKPLLTDGALIRFGSSVDAGVAVQLTGTAERASALLTLVWLFARMTATVYDKLTRRGEALLAHRAMESLLTAVELHMDAQVFRPAERLAARRTLERFLSAVNSAVPDQLSETCKPTVADGTFKRFLARVRSPVNG